jgi:hypothetical protein
MDSGLPRFTLACILTMSLTSHVHAEAKLKTWSGLPFSATQHEFEQVQPDRVSVSRISISPQGLRSVSVKNPDSDIQGVITIMNFQSGKLWLADPLMKSYVLLEGGKKSQSKEDRRGLFNDKPCDTYTGTKLLGKTVVAGRATQKWLCLGKGKKDSAEQYYDPVLHMVIREVVHGHVSELSEIKPAKQPNTLFLPPAGYKKYSLKEMMLGYARLPEYKKSKSGKSNSQTPDVQ